ncbi:MAG: hypothetical protein JOY80_10295 [Candidatus Dormibacteraeota bacterium]|nr:hypothetical protein [Candidatus Dormibacteraeota bacterium]
MSDRQLRLSFGRHEEGDGEMCVMEAVAQASGDGWTDRPASVSPVISALLRSWNDGIEERDRQILTVLVPLVAGTAASPELELLRSLMAVDWHCRVFTAAWLQAAGLSAEADALEATVLAGRRGFEPLVRALQTARSAAAHRRSGLLEEARECVDRAAGRVQSREAARTWALAWDAWLASNIASSRVAAVASASASAWDSEHFTRGSDGHHTIDHDALGLARSSARDAAWVVACRAAWNVTWAFDPGSAEQNPSSWEALSGAAADAATSAVRPTVEAIQPSFLRLMARLATMQPSA